MTKALQLQEGQDLNLAATITIAGLKGKSLELKVVIRTAAAAVTVNGFLLVYSLGSSRRALVPA